MALTQNDNNATSLASYIRTAYIPASHVVVGDVLVTDHNVYEVAQIESQPVPEHLKVYPIWANAAHSISLMDEDGNGDMLPDTSKVTIISRDCLCPKV